MDVLSAVVVMLGALWLFIHHLGCEHPQHFSHSANSTHGIKGGLGCGLICIFLHKHISVFSEHFVHVLHLSASQRRERQLAIH